MLRPLQEGDFDHLYAIASDPLVWEQHPAKERAEEPVYRQFFADAIGSGGALTATDRSDGRIIGTSRFDRYDAHRSEVEIGWTMLARSHWGGAYNAEMKRLMLDHAFRFVERVVFRVHSHNFRSQRAVEKLGAARVGAEPESLGRGQNFVFALEASAWR